MRLVPLAALLAAGPITLAQNPPAGGTVEGTVVNSVTGAGIGGASVTLFSGNQYQTTSDALGHFKITGIVPGGYRTSVGKDGFAPLALFSNPEVRVTASSDPVTLELKLTPLNAIRGRVFGPDGKPLAGMDVNLNPNIWGNVVTDQEGRFALESVKPGSYTLSARPPASVKPEEAKDGTRTAMVTTYYPSVADGSLAQPIAFRGEGDLIGYDIHMQTAPVHRVRGIVLDEGGKPSPGAELTLFPSSNAPPSPMGLSSRAGRSSLFLMGARRAPTGMAEATVRSGKDGRFELPAVPSGDWRIGVESNPSGTADVRVGREDIDNFQVHVAMSFRLTGTIDWQGARSQPASNPSVFALVTLLTADTNEFVSGGLVESGRIPLYEHIQPGRYKAIARPGLSAQIFLGEAEVTGQTFSLTANGPPFRMVLKTWSGTVRGTVGNGEGATVMLVPQRGEGVAIGQTIRCGSGGSFELNEVSPGDYYMAAFDHMDPFAPSAAMVALMLSRGTSVRVEEGSSANVMLSVIAAP
jgi:hypothetical protein